MMMENTNIVTAEQQTPNTISASNAIFNVQALTQLQSVAGLMAQAAVTVPEHLRGNPADCMAIMRAFCSLQNDSTRAPKINPVT